MEYRIHKAKSRPSLKGLWDEQAWQEAETGTIKHFHARSSKHHPKVEFKLTWVEEDGLYIFFRVLDKYVRCTSTEYQSSVCRDSCVEFFVKPSPRHGYFNFETNCGGAMLLSYIEDPTRGENGFARHEMVPYELARPITLYHSMPNVVEPELKENTEWMIEYCIPFKLFEHYLGPLGRLPDQTWQGNLYKCADESSHPHWGSWSPIGKELNFHVPEYFAPLLFMESDDKA